MISLPLYWKCRLSIKPKQTSNLYLENLKNYLANNILQEEALSADIKNNYIHFKVGLCRPFWSWKLLVAITSGIISLTEEKGVIYIEYKLTFEYLIIGATIIMIPIGFIHGIASLADIAILAGLWFWLVGGNILIAGIRFRGFMKRCASEAEAFVYHWDENKGNRSV